MRTVQLLRLLTRSALAFIFFVLVTGSTAVLAQTTYYVDTGGSNAFNGLTPATAFQTITHAIGQAAAGDIISIEAGTYTENVVVTGKNNLRFESRPDGVISTVTIDGNFTNDASGTQVGVTGDGDFEVAGAARVLTLQSGTVAVDDFALPSGVTIIRQAGAITGNIDFPAGAINVTYTGTGNITAGAELPADLNEGNLIVSQAGTVTLPAQVEVDDLQIDAGATVVGTVVLGGNTAGNEHDVTGTGTAGTLIVQQIANLNSAITLTGALDVRNGGTVNLGANVTVGSVALVLGGTLNIGANTLNVTGNFTRTGGAINMAGAGVLGFTGANSATFTGGPNLTLTNLVINKSGDAVVTITQDVNITGNFTITSGTADLGARTVTVSGTGTVTNNGTLTQTDGVLLFTGAATIAGTGTFGSITLLEDISLGSPSVRFSGNLNLQAGGIAAGAGEDISPIGDNATVTRNLAEAGTAISGAGTFNAQNVRYNLTLSGALGGGSPVVGGEFNVANLRNLSITATNGTVDASAAAGGTISGNVTIPAASEAANAVTLLWPEANVTIAGTLSVGARQTIDTGAAHNLILSGNGLTHSVAGRITGSDTVQITGVNVAVTGSTETTFAAAELPAVRVDTSATLTNVQIINGLVTVSNDASLALGMAHEMQVTGGFSIGTNADLTLNSTVNVTGGTVVGGAGATYDGSGRLVLNGATAIGTAGAAIPELQVLQAVSLTDNVEVSDSLIVAATITAPATDTLTVSGALRSAGGTIVAGGGEVVFDDATAILGGAATIVPNVTIEDALSIVSTVANTARTLTLDGNLTLSGALDLGINSLSVAGNLVNDGGSVAATTGAIISGAGNIVPNGTLTIPNLTIAANTQITGAAGTLAVPGVLTLDAQLSRDTDNKVLSIGDGATIVLGVANPLQFAPTFAGTPNVTVNVTQTSANELPTSGNLQNLTVATGVTYTLARNVTVGGTLSMAGTIVNAGNTLTLGPGGTLSLLPGHTLPTVSATNYNLTFAAGSTTTSAAEFLPAPAQVVTLTSNVGAGQTLTLHDTLTVTNLVQQSGNLDFGGFSQTVRGNATLNFANIVPGGPAVLRFAGPGNHTLSVAGNSTVPDELDIEIAKTNNGRVTLTGGNLDLRQNLQTLILTSGEFETAGNAAIILYQDATTQGFTRNAGMITGNVQKRLYEGDPFGQIPAGEPGATAQRSARYEFPTGAPGGEYRPMALTFLNSIEQRTDLTVRHEPTSPGGTAGLPLSGGAGVTVSGYPAYYWFVGASQSLGQAQSFNVELTATELGVNIEDVEDLRIIRRFDPSPLNPWVLQGVAANYSNVVVGDDDALVRVTGSTGGIVTQASRFTIGRTELPPAITFEAMPGEFAELTDTTVIQATAGETTEVNLQFSAQDVGQAATISLVNAPEWVTLTNVAAETAVLTIEPPVDSIGASVPVTIAVVDPDDSLSVTFTIQVVELVGDLAVSGQPADTSFVEPGETFTFNLTATGGVGDVTFALADTTVENATLTQSNRTATFTFTPDTTQVDSTFTFSIDISDEDTTITVDFAVRVEVIPLVLGDPDRDQEVTPADASLVLRHVTGQVDLTGNAAIAADVSGNGTISAFDASLILQFLVDLIECFPADEECEAEAGKSINPGEGDLAWGKVDLGENGLMMHVPINLAGSVDGIYSVELTAVVDANRATVLGVSGTNLPEGWQIVWALADDGRLRVAMAGATPLANPGEIARVALQLAQESDKVTLTAEGQVNERGISYLGEAAVAEVPTEFSLGSNYPNPFNPSTTFTYSLPQAGKVLVQIFDVTGRRVRMLVNEEKEAGVYNVMWDGRNDANLQVASGMYVYQIRSGSFVQAKKMMLIK